VERCVAHDNGWLNTNVGGPVGIMLWDSSYSVLQYNEAYRNRTANAVDGDGLDLDQFCDHCVMQYNYTHDNDGAGLFVCSNGNAPTAYNIVRYNVSENDARTATGAGGIWVSGNHTDVYCNTVYMSPGAGPALSIWVPNPASDYAIHVFNNIFVT